MKIAYFDCFSGASGDMINGAFIDAGLDINLLRGELSRLPLGDYTISAEKTLRKGISGTEFTVEHGDDHSHRSFSDIADIISSAGYETRIEKRALGIFRLLAEAESAVHLVPVDEVRFHEVGAVDSIIDIVSAAVAVESLGIDDLRSSPLPCGSGFTDSGHGKLPLPAPAVLKILKGVPVYDSGVRTELVTPTGAAIIRYLVSGFGGYPEMKIISDGYGAGSKDLKLPNLLRIVIGETGSAGISDSVLIAETNIDDMNPEFYGFVIERLFSAGALDALVIPSIMKKGRPGALLKVIFQNDKKRELLDILFRETTTAGIRIYRAEREILGRRKIEVETEFGHVGVKILENPDGDILSFSPEYEECRRIALKKGVPLKSVYDSAKRAAGLKKGDVETVYIDEGRAGGMVQIYTGNGKGKTTAALGLALRAAGRGINCRIIRFMKNIDSGEINSLGALSDFISVATFGIDGFCDSGNNDSLNLHRPEALRGYEASAAAVKDCNYGIVILDEIITACSLGLLTEEMLLSLITGKDPAVEIVMTGRGAGDKIKDAADLVTEMNMIKHYYDSGIEARRGVEY